MTPPAPRPRRSPDPLLMALTVILLLCIGVIAWDQTRTFPASGAAPGQGTSAPAPSGGGNDDPYGDLK